MTASRRFRSAGEAEAWLLGLINYENLTGYRATTRSHDLERFTDRLLRAGWRPGAVPTVHVGGTNAKGTVSTLIEHVLRAGGERTGLYTSPHLRDMRERIRLDGAPVSRTAFRTRIQNLAGRFEAEPGAGFRTTFECLTAAALLEFQDARLTRAVIEVGLGGRLDATNVIPPGPAVITPISLDHQHVLGNTVGEIAADKAHILKSGGLGFVMPQTPEARRALERRARNHGVPLVDVASVVTVEPAAWSRTGTRFRVRGAVDHGVVATGLLGEHQAQNVAAAVAVAEHVLPRRRAAAGVRRGLHRATVAGRVQPLRRGGRWFLIDGGHNPAAGAALARAVTRHFPGQRVVALVGMASDKDHAGYLRELAPVVERFVFTRSGNPRAADPRVLHAAVGNGGITPDVGTGLRRVMSIRADLVLVAGSFLVAGEALDLL